MKKTSMPNPAKSLGYIKCHSSSSPRPVKSSSNSIRYNCDKICSWSRRPKTMLEIRKKTYFSRWSTILLFTSFSKTLLTTERRLTGRWFLALYLSPNILKCWDHWWNVPTIWKTRLLKTLIKEFSYYERKFRLTVL